MLTTALVYQQVSGHGVGSLATPHAIGKLLLVGVVGGSVVGWVVLRLMTILAGGED